MDLDSFTKRAAAVLDEIREALATIEEAAQNDDDPAWLDLSRSYALLVSPLRDFLTGAERGRPLPRHLAKRLGELRTALLPHRERVGMLGLHPDFDELETLQRDAERAA